MNVANNCAPPKGGDHLPGYKNSQNKIFRLLRIIKIFSEKEKVPVSWLSRQFQITTRTVQRDLKILKASGFPIYKKERGIYCMKKDLMKNVEVYDDVELGMMIALKNIVSQLGEPFGKAVNSVLDRLMEWIDEHPVFIKIDDTVSVDGYLLGKIVRAIVDKKEVSFHYKSKTGMHPVTLEPYRLVHFGGFWYIIGKDVEAGIIKRYAIDRIDQFRMMRRRFDCVPGRIDSILHKSANIWFEEDNELEIKVIVDREVSEYFRRRRVFPTQEIKEEREDGSLIVSFRVGRFEAIRDVIKSWIPHMFVLEPKQFKEALLRDVKAWLTRQASI